ncbi:hypothetical protein [Candidatus Villigracilis affinis]|uniref:hypothetical protein n=1 Tax=Candidatus Villigracilis affinis TaxID=3140682 RepID=UPI002A1B66D8|nr:hypothetical protein [Anaerolineales bacterium]
MIQIDRKDWREYFAKLFNGEAWIENRVMLRAEHIRVGESLGSSNALNESSLHADKTCVPWRLTAFGG